MPYFVVYCLYNLIENTPLLEFGTVTFIVFWSLENDTLLSSLEALEFILSSNFSLFVILSITYFSPNEYVIFPSACLVNLIAIIIYPSNIL